MTGWKDIDGKWVMAGSPGILGCLDYNIKWFVERPKHLPKFKPGIRDIANECTPENKHIKDALNVLGDDILAAWDKFLEKSNEPHD